MTRGRRIKIVLAILAFFVSAFGVGYLVRGRADSDDHQLAKQTREWCAGIGRVMRSFGDTLASHCEPDVRRCIAPIDEELTGAPDMQAGIMMQDIESWEQMISFCAPEVDTRCERYDPMCFARRAKLVADTLHAPDNMARFRK